MRERGEPSPPPKVQRVRFTQSGRGNSQAKGSCRRHNSWKANPSGLHRWGSISQVPKTGIHRDLEFCMADDALHRTALHDWHVAAGGRMVDFAGWSLPVFYPLGAIEEHHLTRRSVGLFDIDHMGQIGVRGPDASARLDSVVTSSVTSIPVGASRYGLLCNEEGGVVDDIFVYRLDQDEFLVVVNAANRSKDLEWIDGHVAGANSTVTDRSAELEMVSIQGPNALELVATASTDAEAVHSLDRFAVSRTSLFGADVLLGRTGYTGEDGVELYIENGGAATVWQGLLDAAEAAGVEAGAVGLSARDSLRFEPGYPLYGHELSEEITPLEARLSWAVDLDGDEFIGQEALRKQKVAGLTKRLETIVMSERGVPREGSTVLSGGTELGSVVSGMLAPTAGIFAANVFLPRSHGDVGTEVVVDIRGKSKQAAVVKRPLYRIA